MKDKDNRSGPSATNERAERLAQALRDNLHRRKAQSRAARAEPAKPSEKDQ